jgi:hypothetical protein
VDFFFGLENFGGVGFVLLVWRSGPKWSGGGAKRGLEMRGGDSVAVAAAAEWSGWVRTRPVIERCD